VAFSPKDETTSGVHPKKTRPKSSFSLKERRIGHLRMISRVVVASETRAKRGEAKSSSPAKPSS
jgi:hypothetical protein